MLTDSKKYGLSVNLMATRVMPSLLPLTMNAALHLDQFTSLLRSCRRCWTPSTDHSAEDCSRKSSGSAGSLCSSGPSSPDSNRLRVHSALIGRRLSDNELLNPPKIRVASHSCGSSTGDLRAGLLPIRRHSSTCSNERRNSMFNLSPATLSHRYGLSGSVPNTSLLTPSPGSMGRRKSAAGAALGAVGLSSSLKHRRSSYVAPGSSSGILQQLSTGVPAKAGVIG
ncbi:uncharacterized protein LOC122371525 [Amphibalanus amphitrite]|uniref:uncharacterized protein LOC122371525 n=1 Tax=Amphibalanus amphitrite TaxID=1232801 RepID=UPI001C8FB641|nr:uncharacterized protein LOC122371525 [Amphibalanus amphitrite]